jgi:hypothetical protein
MKLCDSVLETVQFYKNSFPRLLHTRIIHVQTHTLTFACVDTYIVDRNWPFPCSSMCGGVNMYANVYTQAHRHTHTQCQLDSNSEDCESMGFVFFAYIHTYTKIYSANYHPRDSSSGDGESMEPAWWRQGPGANSEYTGHAMVSLHVHARTCLLVCMCVYIYTYTCVNRHTHNIVVFIQACNWYCK